MTSYNIITDAETDPSAPLTSELAKKWRDNPLAIGEGSPGAPKILGRALDLWLGNVNVTGTTPVGLSGLSGYDGLLIWWEVDNNSASVNGTWRVRFSADNGVTWEDYATLENVPVSSTEAGLSILSLKTGKYWGINTGSGSLPEVTLPVPSGCNAFQFVGGQTTTNIVSYVMSIGETS